MREIRRTKTQTVTREWRRQTIVETTGWCENCGATVRFVAPELAAQLTGISRRRIYRQIEAGRHHFFETAEGLVFICANTLAAPIHLKEPS